MNAANDKTALGWSLVISGLVHTLSGVVAAAATVPPAPRAQDLAPPVEFVVIAPEPAVAPAEPEEPIVVPEEAVVVPTPRETPSRPTREEPARVAVGTTLPSSVAEPEKPEDEPAQVDPRPTSIGVRGGLRLDPRSVAIASVASEGPSAAHTSADVPGPATETTAEFNARQSRFLSETANAQTFVSRKEPPRFVPRKDGSYVYRGHAFSAKILPDGSIVFSDRDGVNFDQLGSGDGQSLGARFSFDLTDGAYRRRGADPYQAERDYVLRGSEELRERLAAEHREKEGERALLRLAGRLERTWASDRDAATRRRAIFKMWDECSDDDVGARARAAILAFVAERLPAGSDDAFTEEELERLNRNRRSRAPFQPYR